MANEVASYTVDLQVNGFTIGRHSLPRRHSVKNSDTIVLTGRTRIILKKNDLVSVRLTPLQSGKMYTVKQLGTTLKISRERLW